MSTHKHLYNSSRWQRMRTAQLSLHPLCRMHLELGQTVLARVVDHVHPHRGDPALFYGGPLQSLCKPCHDAHKQAQEHSPGGVLRGAGLTGAPLDLSHPWHAAPAPAALADPWHQTAATATPGGMQNSTAPTAKTGLHSPLAKPRNGWGEGA